MRSIEGTIFPPFNNETKEGLTLMRIVRPHDTMPDQHWVEWSEETYSVEPEHILKTVYPHSFDKYWKHLQEYMTMAEEKQREYNEMIA